MSTQKIDIQSTMFAQSDTMLALAGIFGALDSDCRVEILYLLVHVGPLPSGEIGRLTNCTPSQVSQYLAKMYDVGILQKTRTWREIVYSLNTKNEIVHTIAQMMRVHTVAPVYREK